GEAFRLGGDEFALLLVEHDEETALAAASSIVERVRTLDLDHIGSVTASAGLATFPVQGHGRDELIRLADSALYWAKEHGKNRVRHHRPDVAALSALKRRAAAADPAARDPAAPPAGRPVPRTRTHAGPRRAGAGHPDGKRGEELPLGARIIFVADAYDAITSARVYSPKRSSGAALAELERCAGTQFDPTIVAAFAEELEIAGAASV